MNSNPQLNTRQMKDHFDTTPDQNNALFANDTSRFWYKPSISRDDAIRMLKDKSPGTFLVRNSSSYKNAYGLAVKVEQPPVGVTRHADGTELVRHFLIETTGHGVRIKGSTDEPEFGTLAALIYQHSIEKNVLPLPLLLPKSDLIESIPTHPKEQEELFKLKMLESGAACHVIYLTEFPTECLTGPEAIRKSVNSAFAMFERRQLVGSIRVHFKVSSSGITLTDPSRQVFFKKHFPSKQVVFCGIDPRDRKWMQTQTESGIPTNARIFGFIVKVASNENICHLFAELESDQPAPAIVNYISKTMLGIGPF